MYMNPLGIKVKKIESEQLMTLKMRVKHIVEKENNGTDFHSFESVPILT